MEAMEEHQTFHPSSESYRKEPPATRTLFKRLHAKANTNTETQTLPNANNGKDIDDSQ
jgi:hypothetical protein